MMDTTPLPNSTLHCTQCGGELHPDEGQIFLTCPYCSSTVFLDKSQVVFHWFLAATLNENDARGALARWMSGNETVKDLDKKATLAGRTFEYFPIWYFKRKQGPKESILLQAAAATSVSELQHLPLAAGDLRKYIPSLDAQSRPPTVPLDAAVQWLVQRQVNPAEIIERALVHIPIYNFKYNYQGKTYTAVVDGASGQVFANLFPAKSEAPYAIIALLTAVIFLCLASAPVAGSLVGSEAGAGIGIAILLVGGLIAAPILIGLAAWVASKV